MTCEGVVFLPKTVFAFKIVITKTVFKDSGLICEEKRNAHLTCENVVFQPKTVFAFKIVITKTVSQWEI